EAAANAVVHRSRQIGQLGQAGGAVRLLRNIGMTLSPELEAAANAVVHRSRQIGQLGQAGGAVRLLRNIGMT
ncbi:hypothetical protein CTI14_71425, partial [Methylobacterium radiotolerans]